MSRSAGLCVLLCAFGLIGCSPSYTSGKTRCSDKGECPSGFICGNDGVHGAYVCLDVKSTKCSSDSSYYCKDSDTCWKSAVPCSTVVHCGTAAVAGYGFCTDPGAVMDCNTGVCVRGGADAGTPGADARGTGGSGGGTDAETQDGGVTKVDARADSSGGVGAACASASSCNSDLQCLGGQCCPPPAAGGTCNHNPECGCAKEMVCYPTATDHSMTCIPGGTLSEGADCRADGENCAAGLGCFGGTCKRYCDSDADCPAVDGFRNCRSTTWSDDTGVIPGVSTCSRICDPVHPQSPRSPLVECPDGFACVGSTDHLSYCVALTDPEATTVPATCDWSADCPVGYYCTIGNTCSRYCYEDDDTDCPSGQSCHLELSTPLYAGTYELGFCRDLTYADTCELVAGYMCDSVFACLGAEAAEEAGYGSSAEECEAQIISESCTGSTCPSGETFVNAAGQGCIDAIRSLTCSDYENETPVFDCDDSVLCE